MSWFGGGRMAEKHLSTSRHARESGTQAGDRALLSRPLLLPRAHPAQLSAKQLQRMSVKCEKDSKAEKGKIKKDIQKGSLEGARIHAENSIRQHMQSLNFLRMSSRIGIASGRDGAARSR